MLLVILGISIGLYILGWHLYRNTNHEATGLTLETIRYDIYTYDWDDITYDACDISI